MPLAVTTTRSKLPLAAAASTGAVRISGRWPHRLALLLAVATPVLLYVGGLVTSYDAGMAVHDWPTTFGYHMFFFPWPTWLLGPWDVFIEHGHRLLAASVGLLTIGLVLAVRFGDRRTWVFRLSLAALALVCLQGLLGGLRVVLDERTLAQLHGCTGPLFFAAIVALATVTSRWWIACGTGKRSLAVPSAARVRRLAVSTAALAYGQIVVGSFLRHIPDERSYLVSYIVVWFHVFVAVALVTHIALLAIRIGRGFRGEGLLVRPALLLVGLVLAQLGLGAAAYVTHYGIPPLLSGYSWAAGYTIVAKSPWQIHLTTAHVLVGSLILGTAVALALRCGRLLQAAPAEVIASESRLAEARA